MKPYDQKTEDLFYTEHNLINEMFYLNDNQWQLRMYLFI